MAGDGYIAGDAAMASHSLPPFHMVIDILNKDDVMASKVGGWWGVSALANYMVTQETFASKISEKLVDMLPKQLKEEAGIDMSVKELQNEKHGTHFDLEVQILGLDMPMLAQKGFSLDTDEAKQFSGAFDGIIKNLEKMDMSDKAVGIQDKVGIKVRNKIMDKMLSILPSKLKAEGVNIAMRVPEYKPDEIVPEPDETPTPSKLGLGKPFYLEATIEDRHALLDDAVDGSSLGGKLKKFVGNHIPDTKFNELVANKLHEKVPPALEEKAGVKCECEQVPGHKEVVLVKMVVVGFDLLKLLTLAKGAEFSAAFGSLLVCLKTLATLGVAGIQDKLDGINGSIAGKVCDKVQDKLQEVIAEKLHAKVKITTLMGQ